VHGVRRARRGAAYPGHTTPFEQCAVSFEIKAPIFVFREWHRHRTQSYNEMSARYVPMPDEHYLPALEATVERALATTKNKQAAPVSPVTAEAATPAQLRASFGDWLAQVDCLYREAERVYQDGLLRGVPKELARLVVPVARYSRMRASANLLNWLRFLSLRDAPAAQWEIREYAKAVAYVLEGLYPRTMALFREKTL
jgi:thymidylate synthase (FAD)